MTSKKQLIILMYNRLQHVFISYQITTTRSFRYNKLSIIYIGTYQICYWDCRFAK